MKALVLPRTANTMDPCAIGAPPDVPRALAAYATAPRPATVGGRARLTWTDNGYPWSAKVDSSVDRTHADPRGPETAAAARRGAARPCHRSSSEIALRMPGPGRVVLTTESREFPAGTTPIQSNSLLAGVEVGEVRFHPRGRSADPRLGRGPVPGRLQTWTLASWKVAVGCCTKPSEPSVEASSVLSCASEEAKGCSA